MVRFPGYPAFVMSNGKQRKEALVRFSFAVLFSLSPMLLIAFLDAISSPDFSFFKSLGKYTEAGQIYFYVGAIIGGAFILVRDNFREDHRRANPKKLSGGEILMRTERTWFMGYMFLVAVSSVVILCVYHLQVTKKPEVVYWSSGVIYALSLYVWFVDILYSQINPASSAGDESSPSGGDAGKSGDDDPKLTAIQQSLAGMQRGANQ